MPDRIRCCVPFCRRTIAKDKIAPNNEWICSKHWPLVPKKLKARKRVADRIARRADQRFRDAYTSQGCKFTWPQFERAKAADHLSMAIWAKCKAAAIEAAGGIN